MSNLLMLWRHACLVQDVPPDLRQVAGIALFPLLVGASGGGVDGMRLHLLAGHASDAGALVKH